MTGETSRTALAARGLATVLTVLLGSGALVAAAGGVLNGAPVVHTTLPVSAGPVRENSPVQYRGITVGRLTTVAGGLKGATLTLRMDAELIAQIPGNVEVRLLPRTLFGDQYIDLAVPDSTRPRGSLSGDATLTADTAEDTLQLYDAYARLYGIITDLHPADLQTAFAALADTLRGRGAELGTMIDDATELAETVSPMLDSLGENITTVTRLSQDLSASAPDLLHSLDDAAALSRTVVAERDAFGEVLAAGIDATSVSQRLLADHGEQAIQLVQAGQPLSDVLARYPHAAEEALEAAHFFLEGGKRAFSSGLFKIEAGLTLDQPYPYTAGEDCPRYPGLDGPNCGAASSTQRKPHPGPQQQPHPEPQQQPPQGGLTGPVGSPQEQDTMAELGPLVPGLPANAAGDTELLTLLLGPLVRGGEVVVP